jgi:hypothetical protein
MTRPAWLTLGQSVVRLRPRRLVEAPATNVFIRHLNGDPPEMAERAAKALGGKRALLMADLVVAECV